MRDIRHPGEGMGPQPKAGKAPRAWEQGAARAPGMGWGSCTYHSPHYFISADKNKPKQSPGGGLFLQLTEERQENSFGFVLSMPGFLQASLGAAGAEGRSSARGGKLMLLDWINPSTSSGRAVGARAVNHSSRKQREMNRICLGLTEPKNPPSFTPSLRAEPHMSLGPSLECSVLLYLL